MALFRWRDLYPYGFVDSNGIGVDYPYMNNSHYPFVDTIFRITPEDYNIPNEYSQSGKVPQNITQIDDPLVRWTANRIKIVKTGIDEYVNIPINMRWDFTGRMKKSVNMRQV
jgi:hypothetical protein